MESVTIDFRCGDCGTIRRVDANLCCSIAAHLPTGWKVIGAGTSISSSTVVCASCVGVPSAEVDETDEGYMKMATENLYRSPDSKWAGNKIAAEAAEDKAELLYEPGSPESQALAEGYARLAAEGYAKLAADPEAARRARADERRAQASATHLSAGPTTPSDNPGFSARGRASGDLTPPTSTAPIPSFNTTCPDCGHEIGETQAWVPDPTAGGFVRIHRHCLNLRHQR